jgi:hypothetical protein
MKRFSYLECRFTWSENIKQTLLNLGQEGWELVAVTQELDGTENEKNQRALLLRYTFKKEDFN